MRRTLRTLRVLAGLLLSLVLLVVAAGAGVVWLTLPGGDASASIPGLSAPVDITVDSDGVPRVKAATERDSAAALGWLHARDRLFQMDLMRRAAAGELAEVAGEPALQVDRMMRTLGVRRRAEADLATLPAEARAILDAYAAGVNAWIAARGRFSALEFAVLGTPRNWTAVDSLLWGKTMGMYLSGNWREELARAQLDSRMPPALVDELWPPADTPGNPQASLAGVAGKLAQAIPTFPDPFTLPAEESNEWAVDAAHSTTGAPLLAGDPHLGFSLPGIWYLARIETPAGVLAGATAPGVPFLVIGRNSHIAWTFTTTGADVQDLFVETPAGDGKYQTPDGPAPFSVRTEHIKVRGAPEEVWTVRETRHGPVVSDIVQAPGSPILALSAANLAPGDGAAEGLMALNRATDVAAAGAAAALITSPIQNLLVADRSGIGLFVTGRVPIRRAGDGARPAPGADGSHDWIGWASGAQLPHYVNPLSGRLVNANERVAPDDFPVFLGRDWFGDWRARRIRELLGGSPRALSDFAAMQTDTVSVYARDLLPRLLRTPVTGGRERAALALLADWHGDMSRDRPQPLIFNAWMRRFFARLRDTGNMRGTTLGPWTEFVRFVLTPPGAHWCGGDCDAMLSQTLTESLADLSAQYGPEPAAWRWGSAHQAVFAHPLLRFIPLLGELTEARIDSPGDDTTVDRGGLRPMTTAGEGFTSVHGASYRGVYDLADLDRSLFVVAPGQSGHPFSRLARNFVERWRDGAMITLGPAPSGSAGLVHIHLLP